MSIPINIFIEILVMISGGATIWVVTISRITRLEAKLEFIETHNDKQTEQLNRKLDKISDEISEIRVGMETKANRTT
jgi:hypothetical protein